MWLNCRLLVGWGRGGDVDLGVGGLGGGTYQCTHERSIEEIDWGIEGKESCPPTCNFVLTTQESSSEDPPSPLSPLPSFTLLLYPPQPNIIWIASIKAPHILTPCSLIHLPLPPPLSHAASNAASAASAICRYSRKSSLCAAGWDIQEVKSLTVYQGIIWQSPSTQKCCSHMHSAILIIW